MAQQTHRFDLDVQIRLSDTNETVAFKVDGERFQTSSKTIKLCSNVKYKITINVHPHMEFYHLRIAGNDLALHALKPTSGEYVAEWNTTGIEPTKQGGREEIGINLKGPCGTLRKVLQCKFYEKDNSHADWGHKLDSLTFRCVTDGQGTITATSEEFK